MSRAFVKETDHALGELLPERAISPHRNLVTPEGAQRMAAEQRRLEIALAAARKEGDTAAIASIQRDLRYWTQRQATAEIIRSTANPDRVRFGTTIELELPDGLALRLRIVGEDEANPGEGLLAYVAPVAAALIGARVGDHVETGRGTARIVRLR